ncbi:MAG TPA: Holliday junction branch migration protein RuvA [Acidimicrobiales bacterium]|nr:Holliday junction branch migration protein RuvA [Acidimicrobiales bacterium]
MIGWLRGVVLARGTDGEVLLDVGGVGYRVTVPTTTVVSMPEAGAEMSLHVHTHVREDAIVLYGFATADQRRSFEALLAAHGVGPSLALAIVSTLSAEDLARAVMAEDLGTLCAVPGVGRKTAARLVLDLRSKLELPEIALSATPSAEARREPRSEVRAALAELGYGPDEIRRALDTSPADGEVEEMLRAALRELAGAR